LASSELIGVGFASLKDSPLGKARLNDNLNFNNKNTTKLIGRLDVHADQFVGLEVLDSERIEVLDGNNRMGKPQYSVEQADQADLISRFAEDLAKRKINSSPNPNLH
jgi:hypothetical protein